ncbi:Hypothetical predicted protein [Paramuricea clavata]|uniref:Uncharacterized protein n=1 Tax=Paramuricea clavata TaxID=317549 RepID=A0A6S7G277_PARCT|nr:Hypothetical predicted protein [Paramuricea clavata]
MKQFLKAMLTENEAVDKFFQDMTKFGGAMYFLGTHYTVNKTLLNNLDAYASKGLETFCPEMTEFKANPTVKGMRTPLTKTCTTSAAVTHHGVKRNFAALLESDDEEEEQQTPPAAPAPEKPKGKSIRKIRKSLKENFLSWLQS